MGGSGLAGWLIYGPLFLELSGSGYFEEIRVFMASLWILQHGITEEDLHPVLLVWGCE